MRETDCKLCGGTGAGFSINGTQCPECNPVISSKSPTTAKRVYTGPLAVGMQLKPLDATAPADLWTIRRTDVLDVMLVEHNGIETWIATADLRRLRMPVDATSQFVNTIIKNKYLNIVKVNDSTDGKHDVFDVKNAKTGIYLGQIGYFKKWRKYTFFAGTHGVLFDMSCLREIADALESLNDLGFLS